LFRNVKGGKCSKTARLKTIKTIKTAGGVRREGLKEKIKPYIQTKTTYKAHTETKRLQGKKRILVYLQKNNS